MLDTIDELKLLTKQLDSMYTKGEQIPPSMIYRLIDSATRVLLEQDKLQAYIEVLQAWNGK